MFSSQNAQAYYKNVNYTAFLLWIQAQSFNFFVIYIPEKLGTVICGPALLKYYIKL